MSESSIGGGNRSLTQDDWTMAGCASGQCGACQRDLQDRASWTALVAGGLGLFLGYQTRQRWLSLASLTAVSVAAGVLYRRPGDGWLRAFRGSRCPRVDDLADRHEAEPVATPEPSTAMTDAEVDSVVADSFPASDPPSWTPTTGLGPPA